MVNVVNDIAFSLLWGNMNMSNHVSSGVSTNTVEPLHYGHP